jgi:hypothetical protein
MFCPGCGLGDSHANQFCRACGTDLRSVRLALEKPDNITESAVSARDEIGRAIAAKIRETKSVKELAKVTEEVLPEIERFLESPIEKRMRRVRNGTVISSIGLGAAIAFAFLGVSLKEDGFLIVVGMGLITFFVGFSFFINGLLFSVPKKTFSDKSLKADSQSKLDAQPANELVLSESNEVFSSVTEHTTQHLEDKQPVNRKKFSSL